MAAHDTLTSSLTSFIGELAANPEWQQRLREEVMGLGIDADDPSSFDNLEKMPLSEMAFKEAMRKKPPVPSIPRRAVRDFTFKGYAIPAGTLVGVNPLYTHHMPEIWPDPEKFDPLRFTDEAHAQPTSLRLGAVRRRRAYVPRPALCLYAGENLCPAFPAESRGLAGARLQAEMADVADPEAARRAAGDDQAGVSRGAVGWAKAHFAPCPPSIRHRRWDGGHASLYPPYDS